MTEQWPRKRIKKGTRKGDRRDRLKSLPCIVAFPGLVPDAAIYLPCKAANRSLVLLFHNKKILGSMPRGSENRHHCCVLVFECCQDSYTECSVIRGSHVDDDRYIEG